MTDDFPCPGVCNRAFRAAELAGADHDEPFTPGQPLWCEACRTSIESDLAQLWGLALDLAPGKLNTPRAVNTGDSKRTKASAYPSGSPGWDAADDLIRWAIDLEDKTRERLRHRTITSKHRTLYDALRYLQAWSTAILSDFNGTQAGQAPRGERVGNEIRRHKTALVRLTGNDRLVHRLTAQCPVCGTRGRIVRDDGADIIKCLGKRTLRTGEVKACGATWNWEQFEFAAKLIAANEGVA